jgi:hypothetical protein
MSLTQPQIELPERYRVLHRVATGGMATVWAAADEILGREVAIKILAEALAVEESARTRFMREARAAARVSDHPNVVTIYDVGATDDDPPVAFIVMELLTGGTLAERLKSGAPIPHTVALRWLEQAAAALDAAHAADVVHRDVKPANLLLDTHGTLKVGDFGIATLASEAPLTLTGEMVGTAAYISPEQAQGRPATDASDRYALGVVAYELVTGRRPFTETTPAAQAIAHVEHEPQAPSSVSPGLPPAVDAVFASALAKDPANRPATAAALVGELSGALGPTAATGVAVPEPRFQRPTPSPVRPRTPRPPAAAVATDPRDSRSRLGLLTIAAAVLLLVGVAVAALAGGGSKHVKANVAHHLHTATHHAAKKATHETAAPATASAPAATTSTPAPTTTGGAPADAAGIEQQAHARLAAGDYAGAIGALSGLVQRCPVAVTDPCAYAWYDLGYALLHNGQAGQAVPVLEHRLQNPDQQGVVQATLDQARAAAAGAGSTSPTAPAPGHGKGHGKGHDKLKTG